jgi:hypothetical protein
VWWRLHGSNPRPLPHQKRARNRGANGFVSSDGGKQISGLGCLVQMRSRKQIAFALPVHKTGTVQMCPRRGPSPHFPLRFRVFIRRRIVTSLIEGGDCRALQRTRGSPFPSIDKMFDFDRLDGIAQHLIFNVTICQCETIMLPLMFSP